MENTDLHDLSEDEFGNRIHAVLFPSSPIQSHEFLFGRDDQLERIRRSLMAPGRQVFVYGERGVGKSSLASASSADCQSSDALPLHVSCGSSSSFAGIIWSLIRATGAESTSSVTVHDKRGLDGKGLLLAKHVETNTPGSVAPMDIEDAAQRLESAFKAYSERTVAVIDEFDLIPSEDERNKFGELIKALGDRKTNVKLIFTGVASALDELLDSHASAHRQLDTVELQRLAYQPRLDITKKALAAFDLDADPSAIYRIANVSNGFPYYVHLLTEHLLWAWYEDSSAQQVTMEHLHKAFISAVDAVHVNLRKPYDKATKGREHAAYVLWAAADAYYLERATDSIWSSYTQICDTLGVEPMDRKNRFSAQLRALREATQGSILESIPGKRLYRFREAMVRGYVRMAAACKNIQLDDQEFDPPPQLTVRAARMSNRKRWMDTNKHVPNIQMGAKPRT